MQKQRLLWQTDARGCLTAEESGHRVTLERSPRRADLQFTVWRLSVPDLPIETGIRQTLREAMMAAEMAIARVGNTAKASPTIVEFVDEMSEG